MPAPRPTRAAAALFLGLLLAPLAPLAGYSAETPKVESETPAIDLVAQFEGLVGKAKALAAAQFAPASVTPAPVWDTTDAADDRVRFVVLLRQGPLIVDAKATILGKSFRLERESMVDQLLAAADADRDGKPTWEEAGKNREFQVGGFILSRRSPRRKAEAIKACDVNSDGVVDRAEARRFIHERSGQPTFFASGDGTDYPHPDLGPLLDVDSNGILSAEEIAGAAARLKKSDVNNDEIVDVFELEPPTQSSVIETVALAVPSGDSAYQALRELATRKSQTAAEYAAAWGVARVTIRRSPFVQASGRDPEPLAVKRYPLLQGLDKNGNGLWDADEADALSTAAAHLVLAVDLGKPDAKTEGQRPVLKVKRAPLDDSLRSSKGAAAGELVPRVHHERDALVVTLAGARLELRVDVSSGSGLSPAETAKQVMQYADRDGNGYLEKREIDRVSIFGPAFHLWDLNGDGKVFTAEIQAYHEQAYLPQLSQLRVRGASLGAGIFGAIDASGDGRLSQREVRQASERIAAFDENRDGQVALSEIPHTIVLTFSKGLSDGQGPPAKNALDAPPWFANMDRNQDGDLSPREFLGDAGKFRTLDADGDGLISPDEARIASEQSGLQSSPTTEPGAVDKK